MLKKCERRKRRRVYARRTWKGFAAASMRAWCARLCARTGISTRAFWRWSKAGTGACARVSRSRKSAKFGICPCYVSSVELLRGWQTTMCDKQQHEAARLVVWGRLLQFAAAPAKQLTFAAGCVIIGVQ